MEIWIKPQNIKSVEKNGNLEDEFKEITHNGIPEESI